MKLFVNLVFSIILLLWIPFQVFSQSDTINNMNKWDIGIGSTFSFPNYKQQIVQLPNNKYYDLLYNYNPSPCMILSYKFHENNCRNNNVHIQLGVKYSSLSSNINYRERIWESKSALVINKFYSYITPYFNIISENKLTKKLNIRYSLHSAFISTSFIRTKSFYYDSQLWATLNDNSTFQSSILSNELDYYFDVKIDFSLSLYYFLFNKYNIGISTYFELYSLKKIQLNNNRSFNSPIPENFNSISIILFYNFN